MKIKRFDGADLADVVDLFRDTVRTINLADYTPEQVKVWAPDEIDQERWLARLNDNYSITMMEGESLRGFAELHGGSHVHMMFVHKDFQRRGIAHDLLADLEKVAHRLQERQLSADVSITARPFFESQGFAVGESQQIEKGGQVLKNFKMLKQL